MNLEHENLNQEQEQDQNAKQDRIRDVMSSWSAKEAEDYMKLAKQMARKVAHSCGAFDADVVEELAFFALADTIPDSIARYRRTENHTAKESTYVIAACKQGLRGALGDILKRKDRRTYSPLDDDHEESARLAKSQRKEQRRPKDRAPEDVSPIDPMLYAEVDAKIANLPPVALGVPDMTDPETGSEMYYAWEWLGTPVYFDDVTTSNLMYFDQVCDAHTEFFDDGFLVECLANGEWQYVVGELMDVSASAVSRHKKGVDDRFESYVYEHCHGTS